MWDAVGGAPCAGGGAVQWAGLCAQEEGLAVGGAARRRRGLRWAGLNAGAGAGLRRYQPPESKGSFLSWSFECE